MPVVGLAAAALGGCGGSAHAAHGRAVRITERDFSITAPRRVAPGLVTIAAHNAGPDTHELFVIRAPGSRLPLREDGLTVDEDGIRPSVVATIEAIEPRHTASATLRLRPGQYLLLCNMAGHYRGGMHRTLVVG